MFYEEDGKTDRGRVGSFYFKDIRRTGCFFEDDGRTDRGKVVSRVLMVGEGRTDVLLFFGVSKIFPSDKVKEDNNGQKQK